MRFEYINYGESLITGLKKDSDIIYVFSDYALKNSQRKESKRNIFEPDPLYLTMDEFKSKIYRTDRIVLNEAKRFISLYNCMRDEFKKININSYFESIEFSDKFFKYYTELNKALCNEKDILLEEWQKKYFDIFHSFKAKYQEYIDKKNYIPKDWIEDLKYLDFFEIKKYKKIIFVDVVNFSPLDKKVLKKLDEIIEVKLRIQGEKNLFDEETLELKEVLLPSEQKNKISIMELSDEIEIIGNILEIMRMKNQTTNIFSPEAEKNEYSKLFPNNFMRGSFSTLNDTKFYKFLEIQSELISSLEIKIDNLIPITYFLEAVRSLEFQEYYELSKEDIEYVYNQIQWDYKYIGKESNEKIERIYQDIIDISKMDKIDSFISYFNSLLGNEIFKEKKYTDFYNKLQEYMGYAKTTEIMLEDRELKRCFKNGGDILKFLLQYFNNVELKRDENTTGKYLIKGIEECKVIPKRQSREAIFINLSDKYLPAVDKETMYLTEKQKRENGFNYYERDRKEQKYRFYQALLKNSFNTILFVKNDVTGENLSPFLSEVLNKYNVIKENKVFTSEEILGKLKEYSSLELTNFDESNLIKDKSDFINGKINIGPYDFDTLNRCEYRFYLDKVCELAPFEKDDSIGISLKFLGIYVHEVFEKLTDKMWKRILNQSDYSLDEEEVEKLLYEGFYKNRKKIPVYLDNYFTQILIPRFLKNILKFYKEIEKLYSNKKVKRIESEKNSNRLPFVNGEVEVVLSGRVDLVIETDTDKHIVDFKTGGKIDNQLDFYSIMLYGDETIAKKSIYNAFDGDIESQDKSKLTKEILKERLINFLKSDTYVLSEKKSSCLYCNYKDICRREF